MASRSSMKKRRLGRGLGSLIPTKPVPVDVEGQRSRGADGQRIGGVEQGGDSSDSARPLHPSLPSDQITPLPLASIRPSPHQPRRGFPEESLAALADSIRHAGVMQPIVVRPLAAGRYELVAGERRWRAAQRIPLETIPAIIRDIDDGTAAEWALIENLQREDLNPIERADAFNELISKFGLTHKELAERVGVDRSTISNTLRLNELDEETKNDVREGTLSPGHAKVLLSITNNYRRRRLAAATVRQRWSVRELERRVSAGAGSSAGGSATRDRALAAAPGPASAHLIDLEDKLGRHLGTKVHIRTGRKKGTGKVIIEFYSLEEFDGLMQRLGFDGEL